MSDSIEAMQAEAEKALSFLEELEAVARRKLAEKSDEQAVDEIIGTAWHA